MDLHSDVQYSNEKFNKNSTDAVLETFVILVNIFEFKISNLNIIVLSMVSTTKQSIKVALCIIFIKEGRV